VNLWHCHRHGALLPLTDAGSGRGSRQWSPLEDTIAKRGDNAPWSVRRLARVGATQSGLHHASSRRHGRIRDQLRRPTFERLELEGSTFSCEPIDEIDQAGAPPS
jgi:hypothetical protein